MRMILIGALVALLTLANTGSAAAEHWSWSSKIVTVDVQGVGTFVSIESDTGCGSNRVLIWSTTPGYNQILAAVLSAFNADKPVRFLIAQCRGEDSEFFRVMVHRA